MGYKLEQQKIDAVINSLKQGLKRDVIALTHGVHPQTVSRIARDAGVVRPAITQLELQQARVRSRIESELLHNPVVKDVAALLSVSVSLVYSVRVKMRQQAWRSAT